MLCQSVGCEDAGTARVAACAAGLTVLILLSSEVLCFESTPAEQTDLPPYGESLSPRKGIEGRCYSTFPHLSLSHVGRFTRLHAVEDQQDVSSPFGYGMLTAIQPITGWHLLFPASYSRYGNSSPCGSPAPNIPEGTITGLPSSVCSNDCSCLRCHLSPGSLDVSVTPSNRGLTGSMPFGVSASAPCAGLQCRGLSAIHICSP